MKKLILIISVLLASVVAGAQTATLTGSFDALKEENLLDAEIDFDKGVYKLIPVLVSHFDGLWPEGKGL